MKKAILYPAGKALTVSLCSTAALSALPLSASASSSAADLIQPSAATKKINVLFIPVDDLKPILGCYGDKNIITPNFDRLAARGTVFLNAYCQQAVCGPTRASIMTGLYPDSTKVWDLKTRMRDKNPDILTLPQYFRQNGYATVGMGKTFDPRCVGPELDKESWSFPYMHYNKADYSTETGEPAGKYQNPEIKKRIKAAETIIRKQKLKGKAALAVLRKFNARPVTGCADVPDDAYIDGVSAKKACDFLAKFAASGKPFFISVGFKKPHLPFTAPKKYWDMYDSAKISMAPFRKHAENCKDFIYQDCWELRGHYTDFPEKGPVPEELQKKMIHGYMASVSFIDAQLGKVLDKLDETGLADSTVICLWGDHGWHLGDHGMWGKHTNLEQATHAPLIFAGPGIPKGVKTESIAEFVDVFPTLCDLCGIKIPAVLQGMSLMPVFKNPAAEIRSAAMSQFPRYYKGKAMGYALRNKRYRYVEWIKKDYQNGEKSGPVVYQELYDYDKDPLETVNRADNPEYKEIIKKMADTLHKQFKIKVSSQ